MAYSEGTGKHLAVPMFSRCWKSGIQWLPHDVLPFGMPR